eukprot:3479341-Prorocentrum_lima.AAC.1
MAPVDKPAAYPRAHCRGNTIFVLPEEQPALLIDNVLPNTSTDSRPQDAGLGPRAVSYTHLRAHETRRHL